MYEVSFWYCKLVAKSALFTDLRQVRTFRFHYSTTFVPPNSRLIGSRKIREWEISQGSFNAKKSQIINFTYVN